MNSAYLMPINTILANGAEVTYAVPTSGYGHLADEQPLPYIRLAGRSLTPRFGGDEPSKECSIDSIPLPFGILDSNWSIKQMLFNLFRRRINIYWRNIFESFNKDNPNFYFLRQLKYRATSEGFEGESPLLLFKRLIRIKKDAVIVEDKIVFKSGVYFKLLKFAHIATFEKDGVDCEINYASHKQKIIKKCSSSTGSYFLSHYIIRNHMFKAGEVLVSKYVYSIS
ncbi:hypothetical protein C2869_10085 [Saccharobesus litoralis]|uniref:Uncharacterized protein n=1 Tax=Saccharobesus litoralis TaxID=2172099 RepID=A0A2S0VRB5_9ALTE|nr:hypothetical protein [Saccharobesus litoralis]AWB66751.1 hypothetical protein C2869_10085 [Saccharobesus litoralis]